MLKNVTIRNASGDIVGTYETFPSKESEQRETLRRFGPGRYKVSYNKNGPKNVWVFVGAQGATDQTRGLSPFHGLPATEKVDLTIYRELILPMANQLTAQLDDIKTMLADLMADDEPGELSGETLPTQPQPTDQASRIAEALQRVQNGEKLEDLIGDYADLIPPQFAGMAPALLSMIGGMKGGQQ